MINKDPVAVDSKPNYTEPSSPKARLSNAFLRLSTATVRPSTAAVRPSTAAARLTTVEEKYSNGYQIDKTTDLN